MYERLIECWNNQQAAIKARPYDPVEVQSWGLAFAKEYNSLKDHFIEKFQLEEFDYSIRHMVIKLAKESSNG